MNSQTKQDLYDKFDSTAYIRDKLDNKWINCATDFVSSWIYSVFSEGKITGETLLDIGTGPNPNNAIYATPYFRKIYLSDFSRSNLAFLQQWRLGEHSELLGRFFERAVKLEGNHQAPAEKEEALKSKIGDVLYCDITQANPLSCNKQLDICQFDAVTVSWCVGNVADNAEEFKQAIKNIISLIKPGGHLVLMTIQTTNGYYKVNENSFCGGRLNNYNVREVMNTECGKTSFSSSKTLNLEDGTVWYLFNTVCTI